MSRAGDGKGDTMKRAMSAIALGFLLGVVTIVALQARPAEAAKKPIGPPVCICPDVYDPVTCSNGHTYSNGCVASCNGATGCVRTGDI